MLHENANVIYIQIVGTMDPLSNAYYAHIMDEIPTLCLSASGPLP